MEQVVQLMQHTNTVPETAVYQRFLHHLVTVEQVETKLFFSPSSQDNTTGTSLPSSSSCSDSMFVFASQTKLQRYQYARTHVFADIMQFFTSYLSAYFQPYTLDSHTRIHSTLLPTAPPQLVINTTTSLSPTVVTSTGLHTLMNITQLMIRR